MQIAHARLHHQRLSSAPFGTGEEVVRWLGAVQAQDYAGAKWALALRMREATDAGIERAFAAGRVLRTHVLRPTWHFVHPGDIRWMLALTAPRVRALLASYDRPLGITPAIVRKTERIVAKALRGGAALTRQELASVLRKSGVAVNGVQHLAHLVMHAELDAVVCSGPVRGKQFTYMLLDERVPPARTMTREASLAELTRRYIRSHGPAQVKDFAWWSGLSTADVRAGLEMAGADIVSETVDGKTYWWPAAARRPARPARRAWLLPLYDEYLIAYKDRSASLELAAWTPIVTKNAYSAAVLLDGQVVGGWKRAVTRDTAPIAIDLAVRLQPADRRLARDAAERYAAFLGLPSVTGGV